MQTKLWKRPPFTMSAKEILSLLKTNLDTGLPTEEANKRLEQFGHNTLKSIRKERWYHILLRQFVDVLIFILLAAAIVSWLIGEKSDTIVIVMIVLLNGVLGFIQEMKAEKSIEALRKMVNPHCVVIRDGEQITISAEDVVPGDILFLEMGDRVPADARIIESINLKVDESTLTGESVSVLKNTEALPENTPLAKQSNMVFMGTVVTNGRAKAVVTATGMNSELGRIAYLTQTVSQEKSNLQKKLAKVGKQLAILSIAVSVFVTIIGIITGKPIIEMLLAGISLAVAVVPEGLPAVVTITLALGIRAMVKRKALLRRLSAAETLGSASVICTDKTGTLTKNEMTVKKILLPREDHTLESIEVTGNGYDPKGHFEQKGERVDYHNHSRLKTLLQSAMICNHAKVSKENNEWKAIGEPTEAALIVAAYKAWLSKGEEEKIISEFSFNSDRKRMSVIEQRNNQYLVHTKGAPEVLLPRITRIFNGENEIPFTEEMRQKVDNAYRELAEQGLRILLIARRTLPLNSSLSPDEVEKELTFLGLVGIMDPPREEGPKAIEVARKAHIRIFMITGDAKETALAIAKQIGLEPKTAITGTEIDSLSDADLKDILKEEAVFARTTPEHKLRLVKLLQEQDKVVAMTGDGVNDAPALKKADIGIAMGKRGTEVARQAADMILTDDNFASIVGAIEEGRREYDNIQKFIRYLLSSNFGEIVAIALNILWRGPLILLPVQILWMNLVTDGMTAIALGLEPAEKGVMDRPPHKPQEAILSKKAMFIILALGTYIGLGTLFIFHYGLKNFSLEKAQTLAFTGIIVLEKINVFNFRSLRQPMYTIGFLSNPYVLIAWTITVGLQVLAVYVPFLQKALHTVALNVQDWLLLFLIGIPIFAVTEFIKMISHRKKPI
ncbi:MAG: calcium-translocating P-type ATPase, SERCA-type [Candidatus Hydrogenedentota bacterium]|nr:MAG: calcium-translocating P-type ATPase, SERCA-type [Candidatus Hydrogenedentota bacterium]